MTTGAMPREPIAVSKRRKVVQVGKCAGGRLVGSLAFWCISPFFWGSHLRLPLGTGYDSSAHFDCAEDYGDWQSKWTDESWLHFDLFHPKVTWLKFPSKPVRPRKLGVATLMCLGLLMILLMKRWDAISALPMILFSKWWSGSSQLFFYHPSNGLKGQTCRHKTSNNWGVVVSNMFYFHP